MLRLRFGLDGEEALTLEEAGARFGVTRERARQLEVQALRRLGRSLAGEATGRRLTQRPSRAGPRSWAPPPSGAAFGRGSGARGAGRCSVRPG